MIKVFLSQMLIICQLYNNKIQSKNNRYLIIVMNKKVNSKNI